jgi:hypothetical protein
LGYTDKMDVIDLIIKVLQEHEGSLDELVGRLEQVNDFLEKSLNESGFYFGKEKDPSTALLNFRVKELEGKLETYMKTLRGVLGHCEKIQDVVCMKTIADKVLEN